MPVYIGSLGRMVKLPYVGSQQVQTEEHYNFSSTLEGKRKAQVKPRGPRTWELSADHYRPNEHSLLSQFADGAWGPGPFVFVSADAPHTNILTPAASMCRESEQFQPDVLYGVPSFPTGYGQPGPTCPVSRQHIYSAAAFTLYPRAVQMLLVPCTSREPMRRAGLSWFAADRRYLGSSAAALTPGEGWRVSSVTARPPIGAAGVGLGALTATACAAPILVWGDSAPSWSVGEGCLEAVVHAVSRDLRLAVPRIYVFKSEFHHHGGGINAMWFPVECCCCHAENTCARERR